MRSADAAAAVLAIAVAGLMPVLLVFAAAVGVARAEETTLDRIKAQAWTVKRWGGRVLIAVGVWFLVLAVFADFFEAIFPV